MLNEIQEYKEYTLDEREMKKIQRLKKRALDKKAGFRRPLIIIARYSLFDVYKDLDFDERIRKTKEVLKSWIGDPKAKAAPDDSMNDWLVRYYQIISEGTKQININSLYIGKDQSLFAQKKFTQKGNGNDYNKITYDGIIADALEQGKLRRYYLVGDELKEDSLQKKTSKKNPAKLGKDKDKVVGRCLKFTAAILLNGQNQLYMENIPVYERFVPLTWVDIMNWNDIDGYNKDNPYEKIYYKGEPLFKKNDTKTQNAVAFKLSEAWMQDHNWRIVAEDELTEEDRKKGNFYSDPGTGEGLEKGKIYKTYEMMEH
jgi:hypothetical protein